MKFILTLQIYKINTCTRSLRCLFPNSLHWNEKALHAIYALQIFSEITAGIVNIESYAKCSRSISLNEELLLILILVKQYLPGHVVQYDYLRDLMKINIFSEVSCTIKHRKTQPFSLNSTFWHRYVYMISGLWKSVVLWFYSACHEYFIPSRMAKF